jgi:hypothetical protein
MQIINAPYGYEYGFGTPAVRTGRLGLGYAMMHVVSVSITLFFYCRVPENLR